MQKRIVLLRVQKGRELESCLRKIDTEEERLRDTRGESKPLEQRVVQKSGFWIEGALPLPNQMVF